MPLLPPGSVQRDSKTNAAIEVKKLSVTITEEDYCSITDPRSQRYVESEDPTTVEYGNKYMSE